MATWTQPASSRTRQRLFRAEVARFHTCHFTKRAACPGCELERLFARQVEAVRRACERAGRIRQA